MNISNLKMQNNNYHKKSNETLSDMQENKQISVKNDFMRHYYPLISFTGASPAEYKKLQEIAKANREKMLTMLQSLFPIKSRFVGVEEMNNIEKAIENNPLFQRINSEIPKDQELSLLKKMNSTGSFTDNISELENNYIESAKKLLEKYGLQDKLSVQDLFKTMNIIANTKQDGNVFKCAVETYNKFFDYAVSNKDNFFLPGDKGMNEEEFRAYINQKTPDIINSIILTGKDAIKSKFEQKRNRFEIFLNKFNEVLANDDVVNLIHELCSTGKTKNGSKLLDWQKTNLIEYAHGLLNNKPCLIKALEEAKKENIVDMENFAKLYLRNYLKQAGMTDKEIQAISKQQFDQWNLNYVHTIYDGNPRLDETSKKDLEDLIKTTMQGKYREFITNPATVIGKANFRTQKTFEEAGLDYNSWLNYDKKYEFKHNGHNYEMALWERNAPQDLFLPNCGVSCISLNREKPKGIVDALTNTLVQHVVIKNTCTNKIEGYARCYWAKNPETGENNLILDTIEYVNENNGKDPTKNKIIEHVNSYMSDFAKCVSKSKNTPIYLRELPKLTPENRIKEKLQLQI